MKIKFIDTVTLDYSIPSNEVALAETKNYRGKNYTLLGKTEKKLSLKKLLLLTIRLFVQTFFSLGLYPLISEKCREDWKSLYHRKRVTIIYASHIETNKLKEKKYEADQALQQKLLIDLVKSVEEDENSSSKEISIKEQITENLIINTPITKTPKKETPIKESPKRIPKEESEVVNLPTQSLNTPQHSLAPNLAAQLDAESGEYLELFAEEQFTKDILLFKADHGNVEAQLKLGLKYAKQLDEQNRNLAIKYLTLAANSGNVFAQYKLGQIYTTLLQGEEVNAFHYLKLAADQGHPFAQLFVGKMYNTGTGVAQSNDLAIKYFEFSANQDHPVAKLKLKVLKKEPIAIQED